MTKFNAVGDVVLEDPRAMRALADPARVALHAALRRHGSATVDELAASLDANPRATRAHLEALEDVGLVERSGAAGETWGVVGKGVFLEIPEDAEGQGAARQLSNAMLLQYVSAAAVGDGRRAAAFAGVGSRCRFAQREVARQPRRVAADSGGA